MKTLLCAWSLVILWGSNSHAAPDSLNIPYLTGPLVDEMGLVQTRERQILESMLQKLNESGKAQMAILVADSLQGVDIESYSIAVAEHWKLGKKGVDNGLLFVVAPRERQMRFEVGYGLEGTLPDAYAKQIIDDDVAPYFRAGRFGEGLMMSVESVAKRLGVDLSAPVEERIKPRSSSAHAARFVWLLFFLILFGYPFLALFFLPKSRRGWRSGGGDWGGWGGGSSSGGFGGFGGGGGGFSGGGGGFGGGGASGRW